MKTIITAIVCAALLAATIQVGAQPDTGTTNAPRAALWFTTNHPPMVVGAKDDSATVCPYNSQGTTLVCFVILCVIAGCFVLWKIKGCCPDQHQPVTFVLQKSTDGGGSWHPVMTNTVVLNGVQPIEFFQEHMGDNLAMYRAVWLR